MKDTSKKYANIIYDSYRMIDEKNSVMTLEYTIENSPELKLFLSDINNQNFDEKINNLPIWNLVSQHNYSNISDGIYFDRHKLFIIVFKKNTIIRVIDEFYLRTKLFGMFRDKTAWIAFTQTLLINKETIPDEIIFQFSNIIPNHVMERVKAINSEITESP